MTQPKKTMRGNRRRARPRVLAEALLKNPLDAGSEISSGEVQKLVHELQVRQTELETQNEELRRVQFELECSRDNFERLYDQSPVGYLTLDVNGVIREVNLTAARLLGNDRRALLKRKLSRYFTSESWDDYCLHQQQVCTTGSRQTCEVQIRRPDGASFTAHLEIALAQSDPGRPARCLVTLINVTRQRQAEAALRENQAQLAGIIRSAMDGIIMVNRHQRIVVGNEAAERIFGCNPGQLVGRQLNELIPTADRHIRSLRETCVTQRATDSAIQISGLRADGVEFPIEASISQTAQIGEECFTVILRDISERVKAEERLRATLGSIGDGFVGCDADWRFVYRRGTVPRPDRADSHTPASPWGICRKKQQISHCERDHGRDYESAVGRGGH